ncbi:MULTISPECIES: hypothetical protein [unclassified Mycobacterium]|uniref:hypothetical protein n=1 Tax=unclassified Mycobacterium TaxID=2642494 RepID=UPI000AF07BB1|nr:MULTISPECIES: hypothetical protein [unclassified Mycobacterium]
MKAHGTDRTGPSPQPQTSLSDGRARRLNAAQQARLRRATDEAAQLYPNNLDLQRCAVQAALDYLCGAADLETAARDWQRSRRQETLHRARVRQLAVMSIADGAVSERGAALTLGMDRMRLRRWSGKAVSAAALGTAHTTGDGGQ